jgi:hypothetical protein
VTIRHPERRAATGDRLKVMVSELTGRGFPASAGATAGRRPAACGDGGISFAAPGNSQ